MNNMTAGDTCGLFFVRVCFDRALGGVVLLTLSA